MINKLKSIFGIGPATNYAEMVKNGALILDVRTKEEFSRGHIQGSINISVDSLSNQTGKLKDKNQTIITCCASGMRSASAKNILISKGYKNVYNGGGWNSLQSKLSK